MALSRTDGTAADHWLQAGGASILVTTALLVLFMAQTVRRRRWKPLRVSKPIDVEVQSGVGTWFHLIVENPNDEVVRRAFVRFNNPRGHTFLPNGWLFNWSMKETIKVEKELDIPAHDDAILDLFMVPEIGPTRACFMTGEPDTLTRLIVARETPLGNPLLPIELRARGTDLPVSRYLVRVFNETGVVRADVVTND